MNLRALFILILGLILLILCFYEPMFLISVPIIILFITMGLIFLFRNKCNGNLLYDFFDWLDEGEIK